MRCNMRRPFPAVSGLIVILSAAGCQIGDRRACPPAPIETSVTLEQDLWEFVEFADARVTQVTDRIEAETDERVIRRAALAWKLELMLDIKQDLAAKDSFRMLIDLWALWARVVPYLQSGAGQDLFGDWQPAAVSAASDVLGELERLGRQYVPDDKQTKVVRQINSYARRHPIEGVFQHETAPDFCKADEGRNAFEQVLGLPFRAVGEIGEGLDPTARLGRAVDRFTEMMSDYPAVVRWELQLLLLDVEKLPSVNNVIESLQQAAEAATSFSETASALPERLRVESERLLDDVDNRQAELQTTLRQARETVAAADEALNRAGDVTERIRSSAAELSETGKVWSETATAVRATVEQIQQFGQREPSATAPATRPGENGRPFDIREYQQTAEALQDATVELRGLLAELKDFAQDGALEQTKAEANALADEVLAQTEGRLRGVVDHAFWRGLQLALIVAVIVVVYRVLARRARTTDRG